MNIFVRTVAGMMTAGLMWGSLFAADQAAKTLVFNTTTPTDDLQGSLSAQVRFAQSQILPAHPRTGDNQPYLISQRRTLLLVQPLKPNGKMPLQVTARDIAGKELGTLSLDPPEKLPQTAYDLDGIPDEKIDFTVPAKAESVINNRLELQKLAEPEETFLQGRLRQSKLVEIQTADGQWVRDIYVPSGAEFDGKLLRVRSSAGYGSTVHYSGRGAAINRGQTLLFKSVRGQWILESDLDNQGIKYADNTWSGVLPAEWILPGLNLQIQHGSQSGTLADLKVGAPTELLIHTIDIGMLTPPRDQFHFANDPSAHREYFQAAPTSRLIVSQYAPLSLPEVILPDGTLLTEHDPSKGDWHNGTMRQRIGKELVSHGIDNANYGINSTAGEGESSHPYVAAQLAAHNSVGMYKSGLVVHGGSGGGGIVTLDDSLHNEFSHEVGHNYGLGHYVDGFKGSVHRSADQINSTWGWDADKNRFIPNFSPVRSGKDTCLEEQCQGPFDGRSFGMDAMAGGSPMSSFIRFTLYTPNTTSIIQRFLEGKAVFDAKSPTGFSKWNEATGTMEPYGHKIEFGTQTAAPVNDLSEKKLASLLAEYDRVNVAMGDGNWTKNIPVPAASTANRGRTIAIDHEASYSSTLFLNGNQITVPRGFKKSYVSDGKRWKEGAATDLTIERKPQSFGVPVTTLIGYYDPEGGLKTTIYPALHGAYGFTYSDDRGPSNNQDCHLLVETSNGPLRFRLANQRLSTKVMNKFHVNIPESAQPKKVSVVCRGKTLDSKPITPATEKLSYTVNGRPLSSGK